MACISIYGSLEIKGSWGWIVAIQPDMDLCNDVVQAIGGGSSVSGSHGLVVNQVAEGIEFGRPHLMAVEVLNVEADAVPVLFITLRCQVDAQEVGPHSQQTHTIRGSRRSGSYRESRCQVRSGCSC